MIIHVVRPGDSIYLIARQYGVSMTDIIEANELEEQDRLVVGQALVVPVGTRRHAVVSGESLYSIARQYGISLNALLDANPQISEDDIIYPGQVINIPPPIYKIGTIQVNGYAFPTIDMEVLQKTLPYLTYLSIFSYEVRPDGSLSNVNDQQLIQEARAANVAPLMIITNIEEGGSFSSDLAHTILTNQQVQETLLDNIVEILQSKNYYGLGIDFEYIYPEDREAYNDFLRSVRERLQPLGYIITTALAPKIAAEQPGLLYEAHDYPVHGALVDHVILMTYEWGYTYGPPLPVAPINEVRRVLDYAVTAIPRQKILMGIPNYGYDWTLPYTPGTAARTVSNTRAVDIAAREGAVIQYNRTSQAPYFNYYDDNGRQHIVWFDDARSMEARLRLVSEYNLGGVSYWTIGSFFTQNWQVLNAMYDVEKVL
ncbi:MAG: LysM peptidoglycan-binding domain-containing protein [Acetivibrionales bacterium]